MRFARPALLFVFLLAFSAHLFAQSVSATEAENNHKWLVELSGPPIADGGTSAQLKKQKNDFRAAAAAAGILYQERKAFDTLWNGLAITAERSSANAIALLPGVRAVYPDLKIALDPQAGVSQPDMTWAVTMTGVDVAQNELGLSGAGVRVAVIDTGIDYEHPDLGGCFGPGCRVAGGYDLVGDNYNADTGTSPVPDLDPMDCAGHGTHVSGIIGASGDPATGGIRGVAPGVTFYAYRVFGCVGSTDSSIMIDAMERALNDGAQVVNMSIGAAFQAWPNYPTATASDRLVKRGVVVVSSIGNSGASGLYSNGAPGVGAKVIGVASFDSIVIPGLYFTASPDGSHFIFNPATGAPAPPSTGSLPLARTGTTTSTADGCAALPAGSLAGQAVLIRRGTCSFWQKAIDAQNAGAAAVILYNNTSGALNPTVVGTPAITIPVVAITAADGAVLNGRIASGATTMGWTGMFDAAVNPVGGVISSFSSYGLGADLSLKPDIGAPGGNILSTYPRALGAYAVLSGTSMASPHVAGSVALLLEANPKLQASKVRDVLQNSAEPKNWAGNPALGFLDAVHRQGAGMLQIDKAVLATTRITPGKLSLGETQAGPVTQTITIENRGSAPVTYNLAAVAALATGPNTFTVSFFNAPATVSLSATTVTLPAGGSASVDVTVTPNAGLPDRSLFGGYVVVTPNNGDPALRVPYAGFKGDYQSITVLTPTANGFPWLARLSAGSFSKQTSTATYTMLGDDIPYLLLHLDHQCQALQVTVTDAVSGRDYHFADNEQYVSRNSTATGFFAISWNGVTATNGGHLALVPNGEYIVTLRVLKALGDPANPADWETFTAPHVIIARP